MTIVTRRRRPREALASVTRPSLSTRLAFTVHPC
jgi:hypothetical protein